MRVPEGYKLVPDEPTVEMLAEIQLVESFTHQAMTARYQAMLKAAPVPQQAKESPAPCAHEWCDDGQFLMICTACGTEKDFNEVLQRAYELGGTDGGSYDLEADEIVELVELFAKSDPGGAEIERKFRLAAEGGWREANRVITMQRERLDKLELALKFYADGDHLLLADSDAWDTCSGEPINFLHDEAGTASVEDGSIAKAALSFTKEG